MLFRLLQVFRIQWEEVNLQQFWYAHQHISIDRLPCEYLIKVSPAIWHGRSQPDNRFPLLVEFFSNSLTNMHDTQSAPETPRTVIPIKKTWESESVILCSGLRMPLPKISNQTAHIRISYTVSKQHIYHKHGRPSLNLPGSIKVAKFEHWRLRRTSFI